MKIRRAIRYTGGDMIDKTTQFEKPEEPVTCNVRET